MQDDIRWQENHRTRHRPSNIRLVLRSLLTFTLTIVITVGLWVLVVFGIVRFMDWVTVKF